MKVSDILDLQKHDLIKLPPTSLLSEAVILMAKKDIGSIVITDSEVCLKGMLTFREVIRVLAKRQEENRSGKTPTMSEIKVSEVMNSTPTVTNKEMLIDVLKGLMNNCGERYLPCVENNKVVGVVSFHDVARATLRETDFENKMLKAYIQDWPEDSPEKNK
jgi:CBS domain-containing protein